MHHSAAGFSGTHGNAGHIEHNNFYSNNFNPYVKQDPKTEVEPDIPVPVGTGLWIAGGNNNTIRNNHFYDNWRRGTMIFTVPDAFVCGDNPIAGGNQQHGCNEDETNTS